MSRVLRSSRSGGTGPPGNCSSPLQQRTGQDTAVGCCAHAATGACAVPSWASGQLTIHYTRIPCGLQEPQLHTAASQRGTPAGRQAVVGVEGVCVPRVVAHVLWVGLRAFNVCCGVAQVWPVDAGLDPDLGPHAWVLNHTPQQVWPDKLWRSSSRSSSSSLGWTATRVAVRSWVQQVQEGVSSCCQQQLLLLCEAVVGGAGAMDACCAQWAMYVALNAAAALLPFHGAGAASADR